jgi:type II secretory pathway component PulF
MLDKVPIIGKILSRKIKDEEKLEFAQSLKVLIESGVSLHQAFAALIEQSRPGAYRKFLIQAKKRIEGGSSLSAIFEESKKFDPVFVNFIKVGEESGNLSECLTYLAQWLDSQISLKREISSVTLYPKILIVFALVVAFGLSFFVLPRIVEVMKTLEVKPFITTRILIALSDFLRSYGVHLIIGIIFLVFLWIISSKIPFVKRRIDALLLRLPIVGSFSKDYQLTLICQIAYTLFRSGVPSSQIFRIISESSSNFSYSKSMKEITERVLKGTPPSKAMKSFPRLYPPLFVSLISLGETTGTLEKSFFYLGRYFQERLLRRARLLPTVLEPILLIIIGLFIAFVASAIILPIYEVTRGL